MEPQLGGMEPSGVYAMPQKLFISRGSFTNVLGSLGLVCGTADELGVDEFLLLPLVAARLLLLCETATPTPTPTPIRARRPAIEPKIYVGCQIMR